MKQRTQRIWKSEEEILSHINRRLEEVAFIQQDLAILEQKIRKQVKALARPNLRLSAREEGANRLRFLNEERERLEKRAQRYRSSLPGLKQALSAMQTITFPFMGDYKGVVIGSATKTKTIQAS